MKTTFLSLAGLTLLGAFCIFVFTYSKQPILTVLNNTDARIVDIKVETDVGEAYSINNLEAKQRENIHISGRDKALWLSVPMPTGETLKSEQVYVTSGFDVDVIIEVSAIKIKTKL